MQEAAVWGAEKAELHRLLRSVQKEVSSSQFSLVLQPCMSCILEVITKFWPALLMLNIYFTSINYLLTASKKVTNKNKCDLYQRITADLAS
jgi:hypothetical protein